MRTKQPSGRKMWYFSITFHWIWCHLKSKMRKLHRQSRNDFQADLQWNDVETLRPQQLCAVHTNQVKNELHFMKIFSEFCSNFVRLWARFLRWMTKNGSVIFKWNFQSWILVAWIEIKSLLRMRKVHFTSWQMSLLSGLMSMPTNKYSNEWILLNTSTHKCFAS